MKTRFNLATSPLENNRRFVAGAGLIGILALAALVLLSLDTYRTWRANRTTREEIASLTSQVRSEQEDQNQLRSKFSSPSVKQTLARSAYLNNLIAERTFPWTKMFAELERILPPGVRVISISPSRDKDGNMSVALKMGAQSDAAKLKFLESLQSSPDFSNVLVKSESRPNQSHAAAGDDQVQIDLEARYTI